MGCYFLGFELRPIGFVANKGYAWIPLFAVHRDFTALVEGSICSEGKTLIDKLFSQVFEGNTKRNVIIYMVSRTMPVWRCFLSQISELAKSHPALMTLKSVDVSPASWMAVAW